MASSPSTREIELNLDAPHVEVDEDEDEEFFSTARPATKVDVATAPSRGVADDEDDEDDDDEEDDEYLANDLASSLTEVFVTDKGATIPAILEDRLDRIAKSLHSSAKSLCILAEFAQKH